MKITIFNPQQDFTKEQLNKLNSLGEIIYTKTRETLPLDKLIGMAKGSEIIGVDPDPFGGFEKAKSVLTKLMESLPNLRCVCLSTTSFGWIDLDYCKKRKITVCNIPGYSRESVAEHALAIMLGLAKRIFVTDRRTQKSKYFLDRGFELKGKTLGIIGLGNIGSRVAELGMGIGMNVIAFNRTPKKMKGVRMVSFDQLLKISDVISLHTTHEESNNRLIDKNEFNKMKKGVFIVNTVDRELVNENAMAQALKSGDVDSYGYEGENLINTPLAKLENAVGFKGFAWYTKEAIANLYEILVSNIISASKNKPKNRIV